MTPTDAPTLGSDDQSFCGAKPTAIAGLASMPDRSALAAFGGGGAIRDIGDDGS